ncbi:hypothetical protein H5410_056776 [Solanum commersonii]|uniref:Retrotransposon gag domain-containing protein n=1 Tax=Solanum commersonii TaxID=4109 RepID=A0A9J5WM95_SOLCO|nr:hypothetical protein H5410_056776 [Solanum commersonii]
MLALVFHIMLPRREVRGRPLRRNVEELGVPNAPIVQPQGKVTNVEFREAIRMLSQIDSKSIVEELKKVFQAMYVAGVEQVELAAYQLKNVARTWFDQWKKGRFEGAPPTKLRVTKVEELLTLKQDSLCVHEYSLKFTQISRYAPEMVSDMRRRISLFVYRLSHLSSKEGKVAMQIGAMDIARLIGNV